MATGIEPATENLRKKRIALEIQYDGSGFNGWQIQNTGRTVQSEIEKALAVLFREPCRATASGRTDTGVHALGQIIHFDTTSDMHQDRICIGLNGILPRDVSVRRSFHVSNDFHARYSAVEREYLYLIYNHPYRSPFMMHRAMWLHEPLDTAYMQRVADHLVGERDFASFCKKRESVGINTVRRIRRIEVTRHEEMVSVTVIGNAFLHNMIRIMVGTMVSMHKMTSDPASVHEILSRLDRCAGGYTAPPYGLYLRKVTYDPPLS